MSREFEERMKSLLTESDYQIFLIDLEIAKEEAKGEILTKQLAELEESK